MTVERELGEIHTKVNNILELVEKQDGRVERLEEQVSTMRRWQAFVIGLFTTAGTGIGTLFGKFSG